MASYFGYVSDDDESEELSDVQTQSESSDDDDVNPWLLHGNDAERDSDNEEGGRLLSKKEKALRQVCDACDKFEFVDFEDTSSWDSTGEMFDEVCTAADEYIKRYKKVPQDFAVLLDTIKNAVSEAKKDFEELENKTHKKFFNLTAKKVGVAAEKYQQYGIAEPLEDQEGAEGDDGEQEEGGKKKVWTEQTMIEALSPEFKRGKRHSLVAKQIMNQAKEQRLPHIEIAAAAQYCACFLNEARSAGLSSDSWRRAFNALQRSMNIAETTKGVAVTEKDFVVHAKQTTVVGGWAPLAQSLFAAIVKACQYADYVPTAERILDEALAASLLDRCLAYYCGINKRSAMAQCAATLLDILHVRGPAAHEALTRAPIQTHHVLGKPLDEAVDVVYKIVQEHGTTPKVRQMATMAYIYHLARCDKFHRARDLFLQENIQPSPVDDDDDFLVRYNRIVAQLGLSAFRCGYFNESHTILSELCSKSPRDLRELLGQVDLVRQQRRFDDDDLEKAVEEKKRLVPPHHAIPVTVIEHSHLVLSMANDVLVEAKSPEERPQRSKQFFNLCKRRQNALMSGPPNDDNESIYAAYEALQVGNMRAALQLIAGLSSWSQLPESCQALDLLKDKLRVDGLKVFLITRGQYYASLTVDELCERFELDAAMVRSTVSRLLLDSTLQGYWSEDDAHVVIERGPQSRLHFQTRECCDRMTQFAPFADANGAPAITRYEGRGGRGFFGGGRGGGGRGRGGNRGGPRHH